MNKQDIEKIDLLINELQTLIDLLNKIKSKDFGSKYIFKRMLSNKLNYITNCVMRDLGSIYCSTIQSIDNITALENEVEA